MVSVNLVSILIASIAILPAYAFRPTNSRVSVATRSTLRLSSADSEAFDPLHLGTSSTKSHTSSSSSVAAATAAVSALLVPTQEAFAKGGECILEGRTGSMAHPITMFALFGTSIYSAYLGLKYRELRTIGDVSLFALTMSSMDGDSLLIHSDTITIIIIIIIISFNSPQMI